MQVKALSERGIERLLNLETGLILQIQEANVKSGDVKLLKITLSDGFSSISDSYITKAARDRIPGSSQFDYLNYVIKINQIRNLVNSKDKFHMVISDFQILFTDVDKIGNPISHEEFKKKGNKQGSNLIPKHEKKRSSRKNPSKSGKNQPASSMQRIPPHQKQKQPIKKGLSKPIEPIQKKSSPAKNTTSNFVPIDDLMVEGRQWTILGRIINKTQPRDFVGKKGPNQIMTIQIMDKNKSTIQGVFFGDAVSKYSDTLTVDQVYEISGGNIELQKQQGGKSNGSLQIVFGDKAVFKICSGKQQSKIPKLEQLAIKLHQLITKPSSQTQSWGVIALIKQQRKMDILKTKAGKDMPKKVLVICDPDSQIQVPVTVFFKMAEQQYQKYPYYFKGITVGEYQGNKQFSMSLKSCISPLQNYKFRSKKNVNDIDFTKGVEQSSSKPRHLSNLKHLTEDQAKATEIAPTWHDVRCFIHTIRTSGTLWYMGCPSCKKKTLTEGPFKCTKCNNSYPKPKFYYILNMQVMDSYTSIWVTMYDQVAQVILEGLKADDAKDMDNETFREKVKHTRNKEIRVLIMSKAQTYEGVTRVKNSVNKLIPLDFASEAKDLLKLIKQYEYQ